MDIGANFSIQPLMQGYAQQVVARGNGVEALDNRATSEGSRQLASSRAELLQAPFDTRQAKEDGLHNNDSSISAFQAPGFRFEYQDRQQVMKVHSPRGALIYQVPSKGQLALIHADEKNSAPEFQLTA